MASACSARRRQRRRWRMAVMLARRHRWRSSLFYVAEKRNGSVRKWLTLGCVAYAFLDILEQETFR